tara:strand:- start:2696 stop:2923 length:228 start_codon:yes stop_codon:yes gene_type:complete
MKEIDLHGLRHEEAKRAIEHVLNKFWCTGEEIHFITGYSPKMKDIVIDLLNIYRLEYDIGDYSGQNIGYIKTYLE